MEKEIEKLFNKYEIKINNDIINNFLIFFKELIEWNNNVNLTSITQENEVLIKHFLDSSYPQFLFQKNSKILDIGAGAGFPSLPLKIVRDDLQFVMLDSLNKRVNFLKHIIEILCLKNISAIHSRIEDFNQKERFDYVVVRAVASLPTLIEFALPFLKNGGTFVAYKSNNIEEELQKSQSALKILGGKIEKVINYDIENNKRTLILIKKIKACDKKFPRGKNLPKTTPL